MGVTFDPAKAFSEAFDAELAEQPGATWTVSGRSTAAHPHGEDEGWWREHGPKMVQRYVDWREKSLWEIWISPDGVPGIELEIMHPIDGELIKMFIDCVFATAPNNQRPVVVDVKSGARKPEDLLQLGLYKVAIETLWPQVKVAGGTFWMGRTGDITEVHSLNQFTPKLIGHYMRQLRAARDNGIFLPRISPLCRSCKVGSYCAANGGEKAQGVDPDYELMKP